MLAARDFTLAANMLMPEWEFRFSRWWVCRRLFWCTAQCCLVEIDLCFGGSKHLSNACLLLRDYTTQHPRNQPSSQKLSSRFPISCL
jgi:hypothetical protein